MVIRVSSAFFGHTYLIIYYRFYTIYYHYSIGIITFCFSLYFRLKDISDRLNRFGQSSHAPSALNSLKALVKQIVVGQNHFAFLLEDGHVCRVAYSVIVDRLDLTKPDPNKS